jgi:hypothetical protein
VILGWLRRRVAAEARAELGEDRIRLLDDRANSFGVKSAGVTQIRGNGCLAATEEEVVFLMWLPRRWIRIPRDRITAVERVRTHLGKTIGASLLRLRYIDDSGKPDSIAWYVRDLPAWEAELGTPGADLNVTIWYTS